jgi:hypothetical protein
MPDDPTEEYPGPEGEPETMETAAEHGHLAAQAQATLSRFAEAASSDPYDPMEEF